MNQPPFHTTVQSGKDFWQFDPYDHFVNENLGGGNTKNRAKLNRDFELFNNPHAAVVRTGARVGDDAGGLG